MRVLVVGANGLLGSNVVAAAMGRGWLVNGTYHTDQPAFDIPLTKFDLADYNSFDDLLDESEPDIVVNCAAMTDVDACEANPDRAQLLNGVAPGEMAAQCESSDTDFVHISTDYVFGGATKKPYREADFPNPKQVYGESKLAGENAVLEHLSEALLLRLSFVWGIHRGTMKLTGFPSWVRAKLQAAETVPLFTDQWVTPTRAGQAAERILDLIEANANRRYHVASTSCLTPFEFGEVIAEEEEGANQDLIRKSSVDEVTRDATRPKYSCLDVSKVETILGISLPSLRTDIDTIWNEHDQI